MAIKNKRYDAADLFVAIILTAFICSLIAFILTTSFKNEVENHLLDEACISYKYEYHSIIDGKDVCINNYFNTISYIRSYDCENFKCKLVFE